MKVDKVICFKKAENSFQAVLSCSLVALKTQVSARLAKNH